MDATPGPFAVLVLAFEVTPLRQHGTALLEADLG